jgi:hypothetical protein
MIRIDGKHPRFTRIIKCVSCGVFVVLIATEVLAHRTECEKCMKAPAHPDGTHVENDKHPLLTTPPDWQVVEVSAMPMMPYLGFKFTPEILETLRSFPRYRPPEAGETEVEPHGLEKERSMPKKPSASILGSDCADGEVESVRIRIAYDTHKQHDIDFDLGSALKSSAEVGAAATARLVKFSQVVAEMAKSCDAYIHNSAPAQIIVELEQQDVVLKFASTSRADTAREFSDFSSALAEIAADLPTAPLLSPWPRPR